MSRIVVMVLVLSATAYADDTKAQAHAAFEKAVEAEKAKDWHRAIDEYQAAYDLLPSADVLYNIAVDHERLEELRDAVTFYRRYLDDKPEAADRKKVEKLIDQLRARAGEVTIDSEPHGLQVSVDGTVVGVTPMTYRMSGAHVVMIGDQRRDLTVEFGEPAKLDVAQVARQGTLTVHSNVDGAQVMVDGAPVGVTPLDAAIAAGAHRVTVVAPGWATYERPIEVPAEGQAQITANLVHPLGWVPPVETTSEPRVYLAVSGGTSIGETSGGIGAVMFGAHRGPTDGALGYGYLYGNLAFLLEARYQIGHGGVRPYLRLTLGLSASSSVTAALGLLIQPNHGARRVGFFADVGGGGVRSSSSGDSSWVVPVTGGIQIAY